MNQEEDNARLQEDEHWMHHALALAKKAQAIGEVPVGAVVVKDNEAVGEGFNRPITGCDPTAHAEVVALRDAAQRMGNYRLLDCTLYVTIEPCTMCAGALIHSRVKRLVFGTTEPKAGAVVSSAKTLNESFFNHKISVEQGTLELDCQSIISDFFANKRRQARLSK